MRVAIVDAGTNTTRLFVADVHDGAITAQLERISKVTRLGAGVDATGLLSPDALEREHRVLAEYKARMDDLKPDRRVAVMTSAVRDASNGQEFADTAAARYGLEVQVLTGSQEARLTYLGATDELPAGDQRAVLVADIGGGSTEMVLGHGHELDFHVSTQAGVVRQADRHIDHDPPTAAELDAVAADVRAIIAAGVPVAVRSGVELAIGVAGTATVLAAIAQRLVPYDPARVHGYTLTAAQRDAIFEQLRVLPLAERSQVPGLGPDRAPVVLPGIVILQAVMDLFGLDSITVSEHDILRGAALAFAA
jgi:exopolyphosphatase/guanosine-5'-triphosphate,3'-diphosphate pyrophosphatase